MSPPVYTRSQVYAALRRGFGHEEFRPGQADVVRSILRGRPTIAVLPTGSGKSLCYQLPALLMEGTSLVISPLIALMRDQVLALRERGFAAASLNSAQDPGERAEVERELAAGRLKLLYVSPERLEAARFEQLLAGMTVPFVAVDEAHCVLRWGHEFRESYLRIQPFLERLQPRHLAAFTATATPELREELGAALGMRSPEMWVHGFFRPNLQIGVERAENEEARRERLLALVREREGPAPALVYAATRAACEEAAAFLRDAGLRAEHYHGGCEPEPRRRAQDAFLADELDALVATNAFGMGIDKPDLRLLVHVSLPPSFEDYYQEIGRAGRDGAPARVVLLWRGSDYRTRSFLAEQSESPVQREGALRRLNRIHDGVRGRSCMWRLTLQYFGDPDAQELGQGCGACSRCTDGGADLRELDGEEREAALAALGAVAELDGRFGRKKVAGVLKGSGARGVPDWPRSHGALRRLPIPAVEDLLQTLMDAGFLQIVGSEYPLLALTREGQEALDGETDLIVHATAPTSAAGPASAGRSRSRPADARGPDGPESALLLRLKAWRKALAQERGVPPYVVFHDKTLEAIAAGLPGNSEELLAVQGVGPGKLEQFGPAILAILTGEEEAAAGEENCP